MIKDNRAYLNKIEFYITNVCNLNCDNCNRLNNYRFSGHQLWADYADIYAEWAEKVDIGKITILGGEPTLNPSLIEWIEGIRKLWPTSKLDVLTNGTRLHNVLEKLYPVLLKNKATLSIATHNRQRHLEIEKYIIEGNISQAPFTYEYHGNFLSWVHDAYNVCKGESWPDISTIDEFYGLPFEIQDECKNIHRIDPESYLKNSNSYTVIDKNNVNIGFSYGEEFVDAPLKYTGQNNFQVYNSNPTKAHAVCISKTCHNFVKGKLYKCHHVALLPEFIEQYQVNISDADQQLLNSYEPMTSDKDYKTIDKFIDQMTKEIPQCKLCPSKLEKHFFQSDTKKIKIVKKNI